MLNRLLGYYSPKMPIIVAGFSQNRGYNPDEFLEEYARLPVLKPVSGLKLNKISQVLAVIGYYFWFFYVIAALVIFFVSPIAGLVALAISPFVTIGVMYAYTYVFWHLVLNRKKANRPKKKTKNARKKQK